jgi:hypothetical protein
MTDFYHIHQRYIVCPYCGCEKCDDLWDYFGSNSDKITIECNNCEKEFECEREHSITYSTYKIPCQNGESHDYIWKYRWKDLDISHCKWCDLRDIKKAEDDR